MRDIVKHTIELDDRKPFQIWMEDGKVRQSGRFTLPDVLEAFPDTVGGRREAGAYIAGILKAQSIIKSRMGR